MSRWYPHAIVGLRGPALSLITYRNQSTIKVFVSFDDYDLPLRNRFNDTNEDRFAEPGVELGGWNE